MPTLDDVSRIATGLPGGEERPSGGGSAWFVRRRPFAWEVMPWPSQAEEVRRMVSGEACLGVTLAGEEDARALLHMQPEIFVPSVSRWGGPTKIIVRLGPVSSDHVAELVIESWRLQAPKYLGREYDARLGSAHPT